MEEIEYRKKAIEFTCLRNVITYCAMVNQKPFDLHRIAKELNADPEFLRQWANRNLRLINGTLREYREEIREEKRRIEENGNFD